MVIFENLEIINPQVDLFGLLIVVNQPAIIGATKLLLILSVVALFFALLERFPKRFSRFRRERDERWWEPISKDIDEFDEQMRPDADYRAQEREMMEDNRDWADVMYREKYARKQTRIHIISWQRTILRFTRSTSNYIWPLGLAFIAFYDSSLVFSLASDYQAPQSVWSRVADIVTAS